MSTLGLSTSYFPARDDDVILETTVGGLLREAAADARDAPALAEITMAGETARAWTYGELLAEVEDVALALASRFAPGERIAVWSPNTPEWVFLEYAAALAGVTLVTVNPAYQPKELHYVLTQSRSVALFMVQEYRGNPMGRIAGQVCGGIEAIREIVDMDYPEALRARGSRPAVLPTVTPDDPVQIQYTSGTTGFPKGALLHHRGITNNARLIKNRIGAQDGGTWLNFMPMFHTSGCVILTLGSIQARGRHLIAKQFDPMAMNEVIERESVNYAMGVPTMLIGLLEAYERMPVNVSSVELAVSGGSMVPPELVRRVCNTYQCEFQIVYGQTETSPVITQSAIGDSVNDIAETVGRPLPCTEVSIRDTATNAVLPIDTIGEICCRGYLNMIGYNDNPEATAKTIDADGWLHSGDLGTMDARGFVRVTGRVKEMIIRGGENLFPAEIENVLMEHPHIAEVAVVGVPDPKWGEIAVCFYRSVAGTPLDPAELKQFCRERLSPQKTPAQWVPMADFPLTGSGKVQKFVLRDRFVEGQYAGE